MSDIVTIAAVVAAGLSAGLITWSLIRMNQTLIEDSQDQFGKDLHQDLGVMKFLLPTGRIGALWVRAITNNRSLQIIKNLSKVINQAGNPGNIRSEELLGISLMNGLLSCLFLFIFSQAFQLKANLQFIFLFIVILSAITPFVWIFDMRSRRQRSIRKNLPYALDLLTLSVEAGLDFTVAIEKIVEKMKKSPLAQEFTAMLRDLQMGSSRRDALIHFRNRIDMMDINVFATALIQADELGSPLGGVLRIQSDTLREKRFQRAEQQAMKAPVKIIFPLALFILPVTGMIFLVPLIIKFKASVGFFQ